MARWLVLFATTLVTAAPARAQGLLDNGLPTRAPEVARYRVGPFAVSPSVWIRELGVDSNVFDEDQNPKRDQVLSLSPVVDLFGTFGLVQTAVISRTDFTWYSTYESERAIGGLVRGRVDVLPSRFRLSVGGGLVHTRERPSLEIERRARRDQQEVWGGAGFEVSPIARVYATAHQMDLEFEEGEIYRDTVLGDALNRREQAFEAGLALSVTPFTTVVVSGRRSEDRFVTDVDRNGVSHSVRGEFSFARDALLQGRATVGYRDFQPVDPALSRYRGVVSGAGLSLTGYWRGRIDVDALRDVSYSYDANEGYYLGTDLVATYTQRVVGAVDVRFRGGVGKMDYGRRAGVDERVDSMRMLAAGVGYNFNHGGRVGVTYEHDTRDSDTYADRRYVSRRLFVSYAYTLDR